MFPKIIKFVQIPQTKACYPQYSPLAGCLTGVGVCIVVQECRGSWQACWEAPLGQWLVSHYQTESRQMVCILICALAALNWDLTCWKQCRVGEGTMDHPQERLGQISGYRDERRTDLCGVWCVAARETVAWIFYHNMNICTASHRCGPCSQDSQLRAP